MANQPSDNSWDASDVLPPVSRPATPEPAPSTAPVTIDGATPRDAASQAIDAIAKAASTAPPPPQRPIIKSIVDENLAIAEIAAKIRRGQFSEARADIEAVIEQRPRSAAAYEALAEIETQYGQIPAAEAAFRKALEIEPGRPTAEAKLAQLALRGLAESRRFQRLEGVAPVGVGPAPLYVEPGDKRRPLAILGSVLLPGLGQIVNGQYLVGGGLVLASIVGVYMMCTGVDVHGVESALHQDMAAMTDSTRDIPPAPQVGFGFWVGALLITLAWLYSLCDSIFSKRKNAPGR